MEALGCVVNAVVVACNNVCTYDEVSVFVNPHMLSADADLNIGTANALAVCARGNRAGFCSIGTANLGIGSTDILIRTNAEVVCLVVGQVFGGVIVALCSSQLSKA